MRVRIRIRRTHIRGRIRDSVRFEVRDRGIQFLKLQSAKETHVRVTMFGRLKEMGVKREEVIYKGVTVGF